MPSVAARLVEPRRPLPAALLQFVFAIGGLGYLYLGQRSKAAAAFLVVGLFELVDLLAAGTGWTLLAELVGPLCFGFQVLTALDAWRLARRLRDGEPVDRRATLVPALAVLPGFRG